MVVVKFEANLCSNAFNVRFYIYVNCPIREQLSQLVLLVHFDDILPVCLLLCYLQLAQH